MTMSLIRMDSTCRIGSHTSSVRSQPSRPASEGRTHPDTPLLADMLDDLLDLGSDRLTLGQHALQVPTSNDVSQRRLRALDQGAADVRDAERGAVRVRDLPDDDGFDLGLQVVLGEDRLQRELDDLDADSVEREGDHDLSESRGVCEARMAPTHSMLLSFSEKGLTLTRPGSVIREHSVNRRSAENTGKR